MPTIGSRVRALTLLLPLLSTACAAQRANPAGPKYPGLESVGDGEPFPCGDKPIHLDFILGSFLKLDVKDSSQYEVTAKWKADRKHAVTKHPGSGEPYDLSEYQPGESTHTWKHTEPLVGYYYQWDFAGDGEMHLTLDITGLPASGTCRFQATRIRPAK